MQKLRNNAFPVIRILIGGLFIVSGGEKVLGPYQNFLYVVQNYAFLPNILEEMVARVLPWVELFLGLFLALGLWTKPVLRGGMVMVGMFIAVVGQALVRQLDITECGCFGELASFPLHVVILFDGTLMLLLSALHFDFNAAGRFSLDRYFSAHDA